MNNNWRKPTNKLEIKNNSKKNNNKSIYNNSSWDINKTGLNTDRGHNKKYLLFNNEKDISLNYSRDFFLPNKQINKDIPSNKLSNKEIISSSNFSLITSSKQSIPFNKDNKKRSSSISVNNNSNHSNSQSNNIGLNHISTNYSLQKVGQSIYSTNKTSKKNINNSSNYNNNDSNNDSKKNKKNINNSKTTLPPQISTGITDKFVGRVVEQKK